jgi:diketogulonate reductase-like aldo/keto reductase
MAGILEPVGVKGKSTMSELPNFLYGTAWKEERTKALVTQALAAGFTAIDTANQRKHYFEAAVGEAVRDAIAQGAVTREALFLQTKFTFQGGQDARLPYDPKAPVATRGRLERDDIEAWRAIETLAHSGKARHIGVSNFTLEQLRELVELAQVKPRFLQNRCYAKTGWDREVRALCREHGIVYQGFSLLTANQRELAAKPVQQLCGRIGRSSAELVFRFAVEVGMLPLTGTSNVAHMRLDLGALDFRLERADVEMLERIAG